MSIGEIIVIIVFALIWGWIVYEMHIAPEVDENDNIIDNDDEERQEKSL